MTNRDRIVKLYRQLLPTGRAFRMANDTYFHGLIRVLAETQALCYEDAIAILNVILPDNDSFTAQDATDWEQRLGMVTNDATPLADRKLAIKRKMAAPGQQPAKGHYLYIQTQLRAAGFDVYVHENLKPLYPDGYDYYNPSLLFGLSNFVTVRHGTFRHGQRRHGKYYNNLVVNSIDQDVDSAFDIGDSLACTFFIGGQGLGTYANVASSRQTEFRQLILQLKHTHTVAMLFINYT